MTGVNLRRGRSVGLPFVRQQLLLATPRRFRVFSSALSTSGKGMKKREREEQHAREIKANQAALKRSIDETSRLVRESEAMLLRHKAERQEDDGDEDRD